MVDAAQDVTASEKAGAAEMEDEINCQQSRDFLSKGCKKLIITLQYTGKIYIKGPKQNEDDGTRREAARFFEILTSQSIFNSDHNVFANKFFEGRVDNDVGLGEGKCVKSGFEKNVREEITFYRDQSVLDFIRDKFVTLRACTQGTVTSSAEFMCGKLLNQWLCCDKIF